MTEQELRELDAWIAENIFNLGETVGIMKEGWFYRPDARGYTQLAQFAGKFTLEEAKEHCATCAELSIVRWDTPHYSTDRAASQEVLERCLDEIDAVIRKRASGFIVSAPIARHVPQHQASAPTLELAIALFAKKLFGKE